MAANLTPFQPPTIVSGNQKSDCKPKNNWWTPLFGWSSEPDYLTNSITTDKIIQTNNPPPFPARSAVDSGSDLDRRPPVRSSRLSPPVKFTDEKARKLRMLTMETESFHDAMYHSAIASRFASDFSDRSVL